MSELFKSDWTSMAKKIGIHKAHRNFILHMLEQTTGQIKKNVQIMRHCEQSEAIP